MVLKLRFLNKINYMLFIIIVMVKLLTEVVPIPRPLLKELYEHFDRIEEILATLEELSDKEGLKKIEKSLEEYKKKEFIAIKSPEKIREALMKD